MYYTRIRETGDIIDEFNSYDEAAAAVASYENEDTENGVYENNFYEIYDVENEECLI